MKRLSFVVLVLTLALGGCRSFWNPDIEEEPYTVEREVVRTTEVRQEIVDPATSNVDVREEVTVTKTDREVITRTTRTTTEVTEDIRIRDDIKFSSEPSFDAIHGDARERFVNNVVIRRRSPNFITYEYKEVRVDELAPLASRYCQENGGRTAILRDVILHKNYSRWATFDCLTLQ